MVPDRKSFASSAPDLGAMEANIARRMRPKGWARGKAPWKSAGGLPPGLNRMGKPKRVPPNRLGRPMHREMKQVTGNV